MVTPSAEAIGSAAAAQASGENFPVALRLLPGRYRRRLAAVYGFARAVDDMGDEAPPGERARLLDALEADLGRLYQFQDPALRENPALRTAPAREAVARDAGRRPRRSGWSGRWPRWSASAPSPSRRSPT